MTLETRAFYWLRFDKKCPIVLFERSPRIYWGRPDVLGVGKDRFLLEIEIKRSMADFRANQEKTHVANRPRIIRRWPRLYWFLVPKALVAKVIPELPEYAGLLTEGPGTSLDYSTPVIEVVRKASANPMSRRLSLKECLRVVELQSNQLLSHVGSLDKTRTKPDCASLEDYQI
jgi:hypothetical protein